MTRFPDTLFRLAGLSRLSPTSFGIAIPIFESLENEGNYYTQIVSNNYIVGFVSFTLDFQGNMEFGIAPRRIGEPALYVFYSSCGCVTGEQRDVCEFLRDKIDRQLLYSEELLEAALLIEDKSLMAACQDDTFFEICKHDKSSAEFYRVNNILRDATSREFKNARLNALVKYCKIDSLDDGTRLSVKFPIDSTSAEAERIMNEFNKQIGLHRAFDTLRGGIFAEDISDRIESYIRSLFMAVSFDLDYTPSMLKRIGNDRVFIPASACREFFAAFSGLGIDFDAFVGHVIAQAVEFQNEMSGRELEPGVMGFELVRDALTRVINDEPLNINEARQVSVAMMATAKALGGANWQMFGRIRSCIFKIRIKDMRVLFNTLNLDNFDVFHENDLLCINVIDGRFLISDMRRFVSLNELISVETGGVVHEENFRCLTFGLTDTCAQLSILSVVAHYYVLGYL